MNDGGSLSLRVGPEEDGCTEDPLESGDQTAILRPTLLHTERVQHFRSAVESDSGSLLSNGKGCEEDRDEPVLPPWQPIARVPRNLQNELPVPALMEQAARGRHSHRQATKDERSRGEAQILPGDVAFQADALDRFNFAHPALRDDQVGMGIRQELAELFQTSGGTMVVLVDWIRT